MPAHERQIQRRGSGWRAQCSCGWESPKDVYENQAIRQWREHAGIRHGDVELDELFGALRSDSITGCPICGEPVAIADRYASERGWVHKRCIGKPARSNPAVQAVASVSPDPDERVVHAVMPDGSELVRYEATGWWREWPTGLRPAAKLTIGAAVHLAVQDNAELRPGRPGGQAFMRRIRALGRPRFIV